MDTIVKIQILGEVYKFKAEAGLTDAQNVGDFLTNEFRKLEISLGAQAKSMNKTAKLLLFTMNIAHAYISLKQQDDEMMSLFNEGADRLMKVLPQNF